LNERVMFLTATVNMMESTLDDIRKSGKVVSEDQAFKMNIMRAALKLAQRDLAKAKESPRGSY
jgi:hypothetical protein